MSLPVTPFWYQTPILIFSSNLINLSLPNSVASHCSRLMTPLIKVYTYLRLQIGEELAQQLGRCATIDIHRAKAKSRQVYFLWMTSDVHLAIFCGPSSSGVHVCLSRCFSAQVPLRVCLTASGCARWTLYLVTTLLNDMLMKLMVTFISISLAFSKTI